MIQNLDKMTMGVQEISSWKHKMEDSTELALLQKQKVSL